MTAAANEMTGLYMTDEDWKLVRHFSKSENWGDPTKVRRALVFGLEAFREFVGTAVILHNAWAPGTGHSSKSYHYTGDAADIDVRGMHVVDQFLAASRFDFWNGIGIYPFWKNSNGSKCPGLHVDIRPKGLALDPDARWACSEAGVYVNLTWGFLKALA